MVEPREFPFVAAIKAGVDFLRPNEYGLVTEIGVVEAPQ